MRMLVTLDIKKNDELFVRGSHPVFCNSQGNLSNPKTVDFDLETFIVTDQATLKNWG